MSNSYTPPDRSTYDPGWNDPPPMSTMPAQAAIVPGKPRLNLNKRVAFPMSSSAASSSNVKTTAEGLPLPFSTAKYQPPTVTTSPVPQQIAETVLAPPPPPPSTTTSVSASVEPTPVQPPNEEAFDVSAAEKMCFTTFTRLSEAMTNTDTAKLTEIRKRLEVLDQMWKENKLNESVQKILYELAEALNNEDTVTAMEKHRLLVTQHINVSTQWATALRQLILSKSPESEENSQTVPAVLPDTAAVQFVDVSSKPIVMDNIPTFLATPQTQHPNLIEQPELNQSSTQPTETTNSDQNENSDNVNTNQNEPKSRFGRIGRILHI